MKNNTLQLDEPRSMSLEGQPLDAGEHRRGRLVVFWMVVFAAVAAHMPALASYFTQDDWSFLAKGAGIVPVGGWPARAVSNLLYWRLTWPWFGLNAPPYHGLSLVLAALLALVTARVALRLGVPLVGAAVAGLVVGGTPVVVTPVFWVSATGELLAALFALIALDLWLSGRRVARILAVGAGLIAVFSKESALALPLLLPLADVLRSPGVGGSHRGRERVIALAVLAAGSVVAGLLVWRAIPHGADMPYEISGPGTILRNLLVAGGWLVQPRSFPAAHLAPVQITGALVWGGWVVLAVWQWRSGQRAAAYGLLFAVAVLAPTLPLERHLRPYYLLLAVPAWGWTLGSWWGPALTRALDRLPADRRVSLSVLLLLVAAAGTSTAAWSATQGRLTARAVTGYLIDPLASRMAVSARAARLISSLRLAPRSKLAVLQATRVEFPPDLEHPKTVPLFMVSPLHNALSGDRGLQLLVPPNVHAEWVWQLDGLSPEDTVLLDAGDDVFRVLGPPRNARLYSALIAISAGQYARGRHDLWSVVGPEGARVEFAYDSDNLPISPSDLDDNARGFVDYLLEDPSPTSGRILRLFEQLFEAVQGHKLFQAPWGEMMKG